MKENKKDIKSPGQLATKWTTLKSNRILYK